MFEYDRDYEHRQPGVRRVQSASYRRTSSTTMTSDNKKHHSDNMDMVWAQYQSVGAGMIGLPLRLLPRRPHTSSDRRRPQSTTSSKTSTDGAPKHQGPVPVALIDSSRLSRTGAPIVGVIGVALRPRSWERTTNSERSGRSCGPVGPTDRVTQKPSLPTAVLDVPRRPEGPAQQRRTAGTSTHTCTRVLLPSSTTTLLTLDKNVLRLRQRSQLPRSFQREVADLASDSSSGVENPAKSTAATAFPYSVQLQPPRQWRF